MFSYLETEPFFKSYCPEYPGWVIDKAEAVQHPYYAVLEIPLGTEEVYEDSKIPGIELYCQGIDGKISPEKVEFYGRKGNCGHGRRVFIVFPAGSCHVYLETVGKYYYRGPEFLVCFDPGRKFPGQGPGKLYPVSLDNQVNIQVFPPQQQVAHEAAHHVNVHVQLVGNLACLFQEFYGLFRKPLLQQGFYVFPLDPWGKEGFRPL